MVNARVFGDCCRRLSCWIPHGQPLLSGFAVPACGGMLAVVRRLLVAKPAPVPRRAHLLLVAEPLQVLGRDVHPRRVLRGRGWVGGVRGAGGDVSVLGGKFRPAPAWLRSFLGGRAVLMPSTPFAYSDVISRRFAYFRVVGFDISAGQCNFCEGFDSRQLHLKPQVKRLVLMLAASD